MENRNVKRLYNWDTKNFMMFLFIIKEVSLVCRRLIVMELVLRLDAILNVCFLVLEILIFMCKFSYFVLERDC